MNFTTNDISSTPIPGAGFSPDAKVEQTPISKLPERSVDIAQKSLGNALYQDMADPIDIFSQKVDPLADYKPERFDPEATGFDRYKASPYFQELGFNPSLKGVEEKGSYFSGNELKYQQAQTWGDVMSNAIGQFGGLAWNSFKNTAKSDARFVSALFDSSSWSSMNKFAQNAEGTPDQLLEQDKEMKKIMNDYAIYSSPETEGSVFNKETFGNMIGQLGFTVGTLPYIVAETYLLNGLTRGISTFAAGRDLAQVGKLMQSLGKIGKGVEAETIAANALKTGQYKNALKELTALTDIGKNRKTMESIFSGMKNLVPGYEAINDIRMANKAGATFGQAMGAGLPGLIKNYTMFNAARAEASMEAAGTYGQLYMGLMDDYEKRHGQPATGEDLEYIKKVAYGAATDNFIVNTGILMTANSIEFGTIMSKFKPAKRLMREAAENAGSEEAKAMFGVSGIAKRAIGETKAGQLATKMYKTGKFGAMGKFNTIRKDFGLGTALHQFGKSWIKGAGKFELSEGLQEILQETSNETLNKYYTDLYNANKSITGSELTNINEETWKEGLGEQMNMQGWKTFLMGATTGLFLSPISGAVMYGREKAVGAVNKEYGEMMRNRKATIDENIAISNQWYENPFNNLREHVAAFKTSTHAAKQMVDALGEDDPYVFFNSQDDAFTKAAAVAFKTGNGEHFVNSIRALGDGRMTDDEFREAFGIPDTGTGKPFNARTYVNQIADKVERYYATISNVKDQFADRIMPALKDDPYSAFSNSVQRKAFDEAAELIATMSHHAGSVVERANSIKQKTSVLPGIGQASSRAFELLGNPYEISETIRLQQAKIDAYKGVDSEDAKELTEQAEGTITLLKQWTDMFKTYQKMRNASEKEYTEEGFTEAFTILENQLMDTFKKFLELNNAENGRSTIIDMNNVREAFRNLGDYMKLNEDFGQYTQAINTVTDPSNFNALHSKIAQGISVGLMANKVKHEEEVKERAASVTPEEDTDETEEEETPTPTGTVELSIAAIADKINSGIPEEEWAPEEIKYYENNSDAINDELIRRFEEEENRRVQEEERMAAAEAARAAGEEVPEEVPEVVEEVPEKKESLLTPEMELIKNNLVRKYIIDSTTLKAVTKQFLKEHPTLKDALDMKRAEFLAMAKDNTIFKSVDERNTYSDTVYKPALEKIVEDYMLALVKEEGQEEAVTEETTAAAEPVSDIDAQRAEIERRRQEEIDKLFEKTQASVEARRQEEINKLDVYGDLIRSFQEISKFGDTLSSALDNIIQKQKQLNNELNRKQKEDTKDRSVRQYTKEELEANPEYQEIKRLDKLIDTINNSVGKPEDFKETVESYINYWVEKKKKAEASRSNKNKIGRINLKYDALAKEEAGTAEETKPEIVPATDVTSEPSTSPAVVAVERTGRFPLKDLLNLNRTYLPESMRAEAMEALRNLSIFNLNEVDPNTINVRIVRNIYEAREVEGGFQIFNAVLGEPRGKVYEKAEDVNEVLLKLQEPVYLSKGIASGYPLRRDTYQIGIYSGDTLIGFISNPQRFDEILGNVTSADEFVKIVDPGTDSKEVTFNKWQNVKAQLNQLQRLIDSVIDEEMDFAIVEGSQLENIFSFFRIAEFDKMNTPQQVVERPTLDQIEAAGGQVVQVRRTDNPNYIYERSALDINDIVPPIPSTFQRQYAALVRKDNALFWVEISPSVLSDDAFNSQLDEVSQLLQSVSDGTGNPSTVVNRLKEIFSTFITSDPNSVLNFIDIEVGLFDNGTSVKVSVKVNPKTLKTLNQNKSVKEKIAPFYGTLLKVQKGKDLTGTWVTAENKIEALLAAINDTDAALQKWASDKKVSLKKEGEKENEHMNVTRTRLRTPVPKDPSSQELMGMQAGVSTDIVKNYTLTFVPKRSSLPDSNVPAVNAENKNEPISVAGGTTVVESPTSFEQESPEVIVTTAEQEATLIKNIAGTLGSNASMQDIVALLNQNSNPPSERTPKILTGQQFTNSSIVANESFVAWCAENLPTSIIIEDLGVLSDNMLRENVTAGYFVTALRTISIYRNSPFKYHEAFHAVFRLLLTDEKIAQLYALAAKEHPVTREKLDKFRETYTQYAYLNEQDLAERYLEEYLADKFDAWMTNRNVRTASGIKGFFNRLLEWMRNVLDRITGRDIEALFYDINKGKYKNARIQDNEFTNNEITASVPAPKLIAIGENIIKGLDGKNISVPRYLPQQQGEQLASTIAALFHQMRNTEGEQMSNQQLFNRILDMYADTLNPAQKHYAQIVNGIEDPIEKVKWVKKLNDTHLVFVRPASRASIQEAVEEHLKIMGYKLQMEEDQLEAQEARDGVRTTADYEKEADMFGGYSSLSKIIREYIGSTTMFVTDDFGNPHFLSKDGVEIMPMIQAVPAGHVYNGMLKAFANITDETQLMNRMLSYVKEGRNPATTAFIEYVMKETGFEQNGDQWVVPKNALLLQQVLKEFNKFETNPLFIELAFGQGVKAYNSNRQDSAKVQFDKWSEANQRQFLSQLNGVSNKKTVIDRAYEPLAELEGLMANANKDKKIEDDVLNDKANSISGNLKDKLGIDLHPSFIKFSIISVKSEEARTNDQKILYNAWVTISPITSDDIKGIKAAMDTKTANIFSLETGAATRLIQIAAANAYFDETVDSMTYRGADNEMRYVSQFPNYNMVTVQEMNQKKKINQLRESVDNNNFLLDESSNFIELSNQGKLRTQNIDGLKVRTEIPEEEEGDNRDVGYTAGTLEGSTGEGIAYKYMDDAEQQLFLLSGYGAQNGKVQTGPKKNDYFYTTPVLISVIEAKSTGNLVKMPVIETVNTVNNRTTITSDTLDKFYSFVDKEIEMIKRVNQEIEEGRGNIEGYHTGTKNEDGSWKEAPRGLRLYNTKLWFSPELRTKIETNALNPDYVPTEEDKKEIKAAINTYLQGKIDAYVQYLAKLNLISVKNGVAQNLLLPGFVFEGFKDPSTERDRKMNLMENNFRHNISQIFLNDFLNTIALRQLLYGNEAKAFKNNIDRIKRMAGPNSSGRNVSFAFTAPQLGIRHAFTKFHHITYKSTTFKKMNDTKPGDKDDAQMYCTAKGMRYALFGFGKLTQQQADIISKMERGEPVTEEEFFGAGGIKENKGATNSMKVVYFDNNNVYLKCSMIPLYRELTSIRDRNGNWIAKPYMQELHNFLNKLEEFEAGIRRDDRDYIIVDENNNPINHGETVVFAGPDTHSKGLKQNVAESISAINNSHFEELDAKYFRLQMENPSNKIVITDPTQAKQQIMSEQDDTVMVDFFGEQKSVGEVKKMYMADVASRLTNNYESAVRQMFSLDEGFIELNKSINLNRVTPQLANFFSIMKETLQATGSNQQILDFLEVREGEPIYDLNFPAILPKYTQIFFSYFSKVMAEKTPGITVALVSDAGIQRIKQVLEVFPQGHERAGQPKRWRVITDAEYTKDPYKYRNVKRWTDKENRTYVGLEKGDYIIDDLRHNYMKYDENGKELGYFSEYMRPAHWKEEMGGVVKALMYGFGVRIPSDDKHQYITLEMVDTLPVMYGSSAVFPQELIEISGADFDIDKLYIQLADTYTDQNGNRIAYGTAKEANEQFKEYVAWQIENNKSIKSYVVSALSEDEEVKELEKEYRELRVQQKDLISDIVDVVESLQTGVIELSDRILTLDSPAWIYKYRKEQLSRFKESADRATEIEQQIAVIKMIYALQAMKEIGLPVTTQKFVEAGGEKLNNGFLNNRILAAKIAMLNNEKISGGGKDAIINTATSTDPLINLVKELIKTFSGQDTEGARAILEILQEPEIDINDLYGKGVSFINNKEGQRNIGAAINSMLVFSLAEQLGLSVADAGLYYNGEFHTDFKSALTYDGKRKFAQISAIVNAMTDNAKERLAAKLGLNIQAVGMTATMIALGIPLKDSVLYMMQPGIRRFFTALKRNNSALNTGAKLPAWLLLDNFINTATKNLIKQYNLAVDTEGGVVFTKELIEKMEMNEEKLLQNISENGSDAAFEFRTLLDFKYVMELADEFRNAASVMKLNQGMDTTWEENDQTQEKINKLVVVNSQGIQTSKMDFYTPMVYDHPIFGTYIKIFEQVNKLAPKVFLERTPSFMKMTNMLFTNMEPTDRNFNIKAKNNILSYLSIKAYINWLKKNQYVRVLDTMKGALIYPSLQAKEGPDFKNIAQVIANLKQKTNNYLVTEFLRYVQANDETNKGNINKAVSNMFAKLSENQQQRLYDSFVDLYNNENTRVEAVTLFNYLLVKDGGQFKSGSFIKYIPPFAFKDLLDRTKEINEMFANEQESDEMYQSIFGSTKEELLTDFMFGYGTHILNRNNLKKIVPTAVFDEMSVPEKDKKGNPIDVAAVRKFIAQPIVAVGDTITIDLFKDIQPSLIVSNNQYGIVVEARKKSKFTPTESMMKRKNELAIERSGFSLIEGEKGYEIAFPFTFLKTVDVYDDNDQPTGKSYTELYKLQSVGRENGIGSVNSMLVKGTFIPSGVSARYVKVEHTGSFETWEAQSAIGEVPVTPKKTDAPIDVDNTQYSPSVPILHDEKTDIEPFLIEVPVETKQAVPVQPASTQGVAVKGENIASTSKGIAAALTNPTELAKQKGNLENSYPVTFNGVTYVDAEAAYQANKASYLANKTTDKLMTDIITAKLQQHPSLVKGIDARGGEQWLRSSTHIVKGDNFWETGAGKQNAFMNALIQAYKNVKQSSAQGTQAPIAQIDGSKLLNNVGDEIKLVYQATYKQVNLTYTISNIEETSNGYIVTLKGRGYNGTTKETVIIENGKVVLSTRRYGGKDLPTDLSKASYNFRFAEQPTQAPVTNTKLLKNENGLIIAENVIPKNETIKIAEEAKGFIEETSFKQTAGSVSWGYGLQWMRINAMTPKQREGLVIGKQLNGYNITQAMKDNFIKTGDSKGFPLYGYTNIDVNGKELPKIPQNIVDYLASIGIDVSQYDASYNSVYDKSDSGSLIIHQDNTETNKSPIITISLGRPMKFVTYELNNPNDFNVADSNNTAFRIAVNAVSGEALKLNIIPQSELDKNGKIKYGHLTPDTLLKYAEQIDKIQKTQLKQFVIDKLKEQFKNSEKTEYNLTNGAVLVFSGANRNVLHEIVFDPETNKKPMESGFPTLTVNKAFKGLGQGDKMVNTNDYRMVLTLRKVTGPTLENVVNEQKLVQSLSEPVQAPVSETTIQPGAYVNYNDGIFIVTKKNANGTWQIYDPTKEGTAAKKSVAEKNLKPTGTLGKIVTYKDQEYIVTPKQTIISLTTNKAMQWGEENGDRKAVLALAQGTPIQAAGTQMTGEQWKTELSAIYSSKERTETEREWTIKQLNFRDQSRSIGATDEQILNTIKCL